MQFQKILKSSYFSWFIVTEIVLLIIVLNNSKFIDSLRGLALFFLLLPFVLAILWAMFQSVVIAVLNKLRKKSVDLEALSSTTLSLLLAISLAIFSFLWLFSTQTTASTGRVMYLLFVAVAHIIGIALYKVFKKVFPLILQNKANIRLALIVLVLAAAVAAASILPSFSNATAIKGEDKTLVLGFDGTSWNVLSEMFKKKEMPHFRKLMESGSYGNLRSILPLYSPFIWNTIASGKSYEKHGVLSFATPSFDVKCSRVWEVFEAEGKSIGLSGYYQTWPPWPTKGFIIPEHLAMGPETFPPKLDFIRRLYTGARAQKLSPIKSLKYLFLSVQHGLRLSTLHLITSNIVATRMATTKYHDWDTHYQKRFLSLRIYTDIFNHLIKKYRPDFSVFFTKIPDNISHHYWKFMEPEGYDDVTEEQIKKFSGVIHQAYREMDRSLGQILENYDDSTSVFLVSDHGFQSSLEKYAGKEVRKKYYISSSKLLELLELNDKVEALHSADKIHIRILPNYQDQKEKIQTLLSSIVYEESGTPLLLVEEIMTGFIQIKVDPDNITDENDSININGRIVTFSDISDPTYSRQVSGTHSINGVIVMRGPHIKKNHEIFKASILDVTPTILYLHGLPLGEDMDGKVIDEAIDSGYLTAYKAEFIPSHDTNRKARKRKLEKGMSDKLKEELRALGYIR
ncbi:alkaline phosphatase family protein [Acidobacteriota bacterium]